MDPVRLRQLLDNVAKLRIGIIGDLALDFYYAYAADTGSISVETGKVVHFAGAPRTAPGGAGNVLQNVAALGPKELYAFGLVGPDLLGRELRFQLEQRGADTTGLLVQEAGWTGPAYVKPFLAGEEQNRLDFGYDNCMTDDSRQRLVQELERRLDGLDVLIINEQFEAPLLTPPLAAALNALIASAPALTAVADCRNMAPTLEGVVHKFNTAEAARILAIDPFDAKSTVACRRHGLEVAARLNAPVFMTRGEFGITACADGEAVEIPGLEMPDEIDPVGAGDTCAAVLGAILGAGASFAEAAETANLAAAITVRQLRQTGTAGAAEIIAEHEQARYVYRPDLADDVGLATLAPGCGIEVVRAVETVPRHAAIIDFDGALSTLRQGWEVVMQEMAVASICGPRPEPAARQRVAANVRRMIERTTGIQTIQQMLHLAAMVQDEGLVAPADRLDAAGYKALYLERLMVLVDERLRDLEGGLKTACDFTIPGAHSLLQALAERGLRLYLASGTDEEDVRREARLLGLADHFDGGIHGSQGNEIGDAKHLVIQGILREARDERLIVIGDGPVEMREGRQVDAACLGVASDERQGGLNRDKRARLIRAGADLIVPDYAELPELLQLLGLGYGGGAADA